jgi:Protein of unknown function (DUF2442)
MLSIESLCVLPDFRLWLRFNDGVEGIADLSSELTGPVFDPLRDPDRFATARLDPELQTVAWPNGADLAPEFLRALVLGSAQSSR